MTDGEDVGWVECLDDLRHVAERLSSGLTGAAHSGREVDLAIKMFGAVMGAYLTHLWADPDHPAFLPSVGYYQMYGSPNPDTVYRTAAIDSSGEYLITGYRGTVPDATVMPFGPPTAGGIRTYVAFDLNELAMNDDGTFGVVLSRTRPAGAPNWWRLEPDMRTLMLRSVSDDWGAQTDPRLAIVRTDIDPRRPRSGRDAVRERLRSYGAVVEAMMMSGVKRVEQLRTDGVVNRLVTVDYSEGGARNDQWYQEGCFALGGDEALLIEAGLSPACRSFSLALTDPFFSTIDWANAQSSLNRRQAAIDPDGVLRVVVASSDPGVPNWLDTTGYDSGVLQFRWTGGGGAPELSVRTIAVDRLADVLPNTVARVSPQQRAAMISKRQIGVQLRSLW